MDGVLAHCDGKLIGAAIYEKKKSKIFLHALVVEEGKRGEGVGGLLFSELKSRMRAEDVKKIKFLVDRMWKHGKSAKKFYEKHNCEIKRETDSHWHMECKRSFSGGEQANAWHVKLDKSRIEEDFGKFDGFDALKQAASYDANSAREEEIRLIAVYDGSRPNLAVTVSDIRGEITVENFLRVNGEYDAYDAHADELLLDKLIILAKNSSALPDSFHVKLTDDNADRLKAISKVYDSRGCRLILDNGNEKLYQCKLTYENPSITGGNELNEKPFLENFDEKALSKHKIIRLTKSHVQNFDNLKEKYLSFPYVSFIVLNRGNVTMNCPICFAVLKITNDAIWLKKFIIADKYFTHPA